MATGQSVILHDQPVDMIVSRQNVDVNTTGSNVDNTDQKSSPISPQDVSTSQQIDTEISGDSPHSQVNIERGEKQHPDMLIDKDNDSKDTVDSTSNSQVEVSGENQNDKSLGNISAEASNSNETKLKIGLEILIQKVTVVILQHK